jgi:hypothetical protein
VEWQETSKIHRQDAKNAKKSAVNPTSNSPWRPWRLKIQVTREQTPGAPGIATNFLMIVTEFVASGKWGACVQW